MQNKDTTVKRTHQTRVNSCMWWFSKSVLTKSKGCQSGGVSTAEEEDNHKSLHNQREGLERHHLFGQKWHILQQNGGKINEKVSKDLHFKTWPFTNRVLCGGENPSFEMSVFTAMDTNFFFWPRSAVCTHTHWLTHTFESHLLHKSWPPRHWQRQWKQINFTKYTGRKVTVSPSAAVRTSRLTDWRTDRHADRQAGSSFHRQHPDPSPR